MDLLIKIFSLFTFFIISSAIAGDISINTIPSGASVYLTKSDGSQGALLGPTPYNAKSDDIISKLEGNSLLHLTIIKEDYAKQSLVLILDESGTYKFTLRLEGMVKDHNVEAIDKYSSALFDVQKMIRLKDYNNAINLLNQIEKDFPYFSTVSELKGGVYYLSRQFNSSLESYRKAVELNPKNYDAFRMKNYLEKYAGVKKGNE